jgi:hypothetical protein
VDWRIGARSAVRESRARARGARWGQRVPVVQPRLPTRVRSSEHRASWPLTVTRAWSKPCTGHASQCGKPRAPGRIEISPTHTEYLPTSHRRDRKIIPRVHGVASERRPLHLAATWPRPHVHSARSIWSCCGSARARSGWSALVTIRHRAPAHTRSRSSDQQRAGGTGVERTDSGMGALAGIAW